VCGHAVHRAPLLKGGRRNASWPAWKHTFLVNADPLRRWMSGSQKPRLEIVETMTPRYPGIRRPWRGHPRVRRFLVLIRESTYSILWGPPRTLGRSRALSPVGTRLGWSAVGPTPCALHASRTLAQTDGLCLSGGRPADCAQGPAPMIAAEWRARLGHAEADRVSGKDPPARMVRRPARVPLRRAAGERREMAVGVEHALSPAGVSAVFLCDGVGGVAAVSPLSGPQLPRVGLPLAGLAGWSAPRAPRHHFRRCRRRRRTPPAQGGRTPRWASCRLVVSCTGVRVPPVAGYQSPDLLDSAVHRHKRQN